MNHRELQQLLREQHDGHAPGGAWEDLAPTGHQPGDAGSTPASRFREPTKWARPLGEHMLEKPGTIGGDGGWIKVELLEVETRVQPCARCGESFALPLDGDPSRRCPHCDVLVSPLYQVALVSKHVCHSVRNLDRNELEKFAEPLGWSDVDELDELLDLVAEIPGQERRLELPTETGDELALMISLAEAAR